MEYWGFADGFSTDWELVYDWGRDNVTLIYYSPLIDARKIIH